MKINEHVSLAITIAVVVLALFCAINSLFADDIREVAPDGRNIITTHDDGTQTMTALHAKADYVEGERSDTMITPQIREAAAFMMGGADSEGFLHAIQLTMSKYDMDMRSQDGRRKWHGRFIGEEIHTNDLVKVEIYSNEVTGAVWRYRLPFKPVQVKPTSRTVTFTTNGVPARLAAARARRAAQLNGGVIITNIETTANAPK